MAKSFILIIFLLIFPNFIASAQPKKSLCSWAFSVIAEEAFDEKVSLKEESGNLLEVDMFTKLRAEYPNACHTGGLGPCLGIAVINRRTGVVYVGHFVGADEEFFENQVKGIVNDAQSESSNLSELQVVLAGMSDSDEYVVNGAKRVDHVLSSVGFSNAQIMDRRPKKPDDAVYDLLVDTKTKKVFLNRIQPNF
jgi:hypothetical protein